jgi:hypothetical protein
MINTGKQSRGLRLLSEWSELWFSVITVKITGMRCWILAL